ncbi:MAG: hypothetical protein ACLSDQ_02750 [Adlercreutzia equolifaciens]
MPDTFEEFRAAGLIKQTDDHTPAIAAPEGPLATPSGKYEVFSKQAYNLSRQWDLTGGGYVPDDGRDQITGLPIWCRTSRIRRPAARGVSLPAHRPPYQDAHPLLLRQRAVDELGGPAAVLDQRWRRPPRSASTRTTPSLCPPSAAVPR